MFSDQLVKLNKSVRRGGAVWGDVLLSSIAPRSLFATHQRGSFRYLTFTELSITTSCGTFQTTNAVTLEIQGFRLASANNGPLSHRVLVGPG